MNIGIITNWSESGAGYVSKAYMSVLSKKHDVFVFARGGNIREAQSSPRWNLPNVHWASPRPILTGFSKREFCKWVKNKQLEMVIFNEQRHWEEVILAKRLNLRTGCYVDYYTAKSIPLFELFDFLICNTKRHYRAFSWHPQVYFCPWGTDLSIYISRDDTSEKRDEIVFFTSSGKGGDYAAATDWLSDRRGTGITLAAFEQVRGNCSLLIHSQTPLEKCPPRWRQIIRYDTRISFHHETVPPPGLYHRGDVYVYPSRLDGIGLTLPEALSCGLAALTTDSAPMNEFVQENVNGRLINVREYRARWDGYYWPESIADIGHLSKLMQEYVDYPDIAVRHGNEAARLATCRFDWHRNASFLNDLLPRTQRLIGADEVSNHRVAVQARRYDLQNCPSPCQQLILAIRRIVKQIIRGAEDLANR